MAKRKTVGHEAYKASQDKTKYDSREIGHALVEDNSVANNLLQCAHRHREIFQEEEYFVGFVIASDPLIKGVMRRKFFALLHLPSPRPEQAIFLYNKTKDQFTKRLWILPAACSINPDAWTMERLYVTPNVPKEYQTMKRWTHYFYDGTFWESIRKEHNIKHLSEHEYLQVNRDKFVQAGAKDVDPSTSQPFDFTKVTIEKIVDTKTALTDEDSLDGLGQAQNLDRYVTA